MVRRLTDVEVGEFFHLAFLQVLAVRLGRAHYVLKGGANLRYFFGSPRYSEDIDLDALDIAPWRLAEKVDEVLASPALGILLRGSGLAVERSTKPKQTATTQRWKAGIAVRDDRVALPTKIEFSHREADPRRVLEAVDDRIVAPYALRAPTTLHYTAAAAVEQKIRALAHRSTTQARDVFDLDLLLRRDRQAIGEMESDAGVLELAAERALELPFQAFRDQVVRFLDPQAIELYDDHGAWEQMQTLVAERLTEPR